MVMISTQCCGRGRCQKHRKFKVQRKTGGMGTMYQIKAELIAAAIVTKYGKNSSCYDPQA